MIDKSDAEVIEQYLKLRAKKATLAEEHKLALKPYNDALDMLEGVMAGRLIERGANNVQTPVGTCYRSTLLKPKVVDRGAFLGYAIENRNWDMLDVGCLLDPLKEFMEKNNKNLPPGIDVTTVVNTNFRKA